jgi:hypothetical protein
VRFTDAGLGIAGCTANPLGGTGNIRTASCVVSDLTVGTHGITAGYSGDAANSASTSLLLSQVVQGASTTAASQVINYFYAVILGRGPEPGAVNAWERGYFDYAVAHGIDIGFAPQEMARVMFLSAEYAGRARTDVQFLQDLYQAFLHRPPSPSEISSWLSGNWNRPEAVSVFAESTEFSSYMAGLFPGLGGGTTANFVTTMYIGLLDRLVDAGGLSYFNHVFDNAYRAEGIEGVRANAQAMGTLLLASTEYQSKNPSNQTHVIRLYRAYLGRFPATNEIAYWSSLLDAHTVTTDDLIDQFSGSIEFDSSLENFFGS